MDETTTRNVIEAALLAAGAPVSLDKLVEVFASKGAEPGKPALKEAVAALAKEYEDRGIEIKEVASGYRIQIRSAARDWLQPLFEERAPRYTRALLETLALIAYRQPITRAEIEGVRGVAVSSNIVRTLMERGWIRVVGFRDVPGKPSMLGTTREFLDYFGLRKLDDLPTLTEIRDTYGALSPQEDFLETLEAAQREQARVTVEASIDESADDDVPAVRVVSAIDAAAAEEGVDRDEDERRDAHTGRDEGEERDARADPDASGGATEHRGDRSARDEGSAAAESRNEARNGDAGNELRGDEEHPDEPAVSNVVPLTQSETH